MTSTAPIAPPARADAVILVGGGGHAKVVADIFRANGVSLAGILDSERRSVAGLPLLGTDEDAAAYLAAGYRRIHVAIGDNAARRRIGRRLLALGFDLASAIHPSAVVSPSAVIGDGTAVMPLAIVNAESRLGRLCIVNSGAVVEHDCVLGEAVHVAPRSAVAGRVVLGDEAFFGIGAVARQSVRIGEGAVVGAGAAVVADVAAGAVVTGVPAKARAEPAA